MTSSTNDELSPPPRLLRGLDTPEEGCSTSTGSAHGRRVPAIVVLVSSPNSGVAATLIALRSIVLNTEPELLSHLVVLDAGDAFGHTRQSHGSSEVTAELQLLREALGTVELNIVGGDWSPSVRGDELAFRSAAEPMLRALADGSPRALVFLDASCMVESGWVCCVFYMFDVTSLLSPIFFFFFFFFFLLSSTKLHLYSLRI